MSPGIVSPVCQDGHLVPDPKSFGRFRCTGCGDTWSLRALQALTRERARAAAKARMLGSATSPSRPGSDVRRAAWRGSQYERVPERCDALDVRLACWIGQAMLAEEP